MKTQLLEDIDDSGAVVPGPGWRAARAQAQPQIRPRPAVWRRAQDLPAAEPAAQPVAGRDGAPGPQPGAAFDAPRPAPAGEPEWLAELMREDAALAASRQASAHWKRRLLGWTAAAGALALLAGGGLWLVEARRVDGALVVVAQTAPAAARTAPGQPPPARQAPMPVPVPASVAPAPARVGAAPSGIDHDVAFPAAVVETPAPRRKPETKPRTTKPEVTKPETKPAAERGMSARQRREETLMQCRALGYDERQCIRRGCAMTRFGLACRG